MNPDLSVGTWIRVAREWRLLDGSRPETRLESRFQRYWCESGCIGYQLYLVEGNKETPLGEFHFLSESAIEDAEMEADQRGLPAVIDRDWDI
jgi:hypothetical protein